MSIYVKTDSSAVSVDSLFQNYRNDFLGNKVFMVTFGKLQNGYLRSSGVNLPFSSDEVNVQLTKLNVVGLAVMALDYKYIGWFNKHTIYIYCNTSGAKNASDLAQNTAEVSVTISLK